MEPRRLFLLIALIFATSLYGLAQVPEEGAGDTTSVKKHHFPRPPRPHGPHRPGPSPHRPERKPQQLTNTLPKFFFGFSYDIPLGEYRDDPHKGGEGYYPYYGYNWPRKITGGLSFEIGNMFWFDKLKFLPEKMNLGVMVVYINPHFMMSDAGGIDIFPFPGFDLTDIILSFKVGPTFAYNIAKNLFLEADFTLEPAFYFRESSAPVLLLRYSPRINIRFRPIYLGVDFSFGRYQRKEFNESQYHTYSLNQMRITLGFNF